MSEKTALDINRIDPKSELGQAFQRIKQGPRKPALSAEETQARWQQIKDEFSLDNP